MSSNAWHCTWIKHLSNHTLNLCLTVPVFIRKFIVRWGGNRLLCVCKLNALASFRVHWFHERGLVRRVALPNNTLLFNQDSFSLITGISLKLRIKFSWPREAVLRSVTSKLWVRRPLGTRLFLDRLIALFTAGVEPTGQRWRNISAPGWSPRMRSPIT